MKSLKASFLNRLRGWRFTGIADQGGAMPHWPCDYWSVCTKSSGTVTLHDPLYGQRRDFRVYEGDGHTFAFEEVSNGVFAVFEPV